MYEGYWQLKEKPFENVADPRFLYRSREHEEALMRFVYAARERKGGAVLVGEYGTGKTTLGNALLEELKGSQQYAIAFITNPLLPPNQLMGEILRQLGIEDINKPKVKLLYSLGELLKTNFQINKKTVIVVDEAQLINSREVFEELRLLLNFQYQQRFLLTLIFMGQPELKEKLNRFKQLKQRLAIRYYLNPLDRDEMTRYIEHRMKVAGCNNDSIFTTEAMDLIFDKTGGSPRSINNICDMSLLVGFSKRVERIDRDITQEVIGDLMEDFE